jgi:hypothetical protein
VRYKTLVALAAAVALSCVPAATNVLAADHSGGHAGGGHAAGHAMGGHATVGHARVGSGGGHVARYGGGNRSGPIYNSCGYYNCPGYGVPLVGGLINGVLGGYGPF